jgi:hypothetical protein
MGCCQSSQAAGTQIEQLQKEEVQALKGKNLEIARPASSTILKNDQGDRSLTSTPELGNSKGRPERLQTDRKGQLKDPNMINTTPQSRLLNGVCASDDFNADTIKPVDKDRHEEDLNRLAMFIPWEKPALGSKPKLGKGKKKGGKKRRSSVTQTKKHKEQVFIPGSGNENILMADRTRQIKALPPLKFNKVQASDTVKSSIADAKRKMNNKKKQVSAVNKFMKRELGFDDKIARLIRQYAEVSAKQQVNVEVLVDTAAAHGVTNSRTSISCPVRKP